MHIWTITNWENYLNDSNNRRSGLRFRYDSSVAIDVRDSCKTFANWLRSEYYFPLRIVVYVKGKPYITTRDGDHVVGSFFEPFDYAVEPYIRIATGDYYDLKITIGKDNALAAILTSISHELTHYYQWINNLHLTERGRERQAIQYSRFIVSEYAVTHEHP